MNVYMDFLFDLYVHKNMLSVELEQELESLSKMFNTTTRNWKKCSLEFDSCASKLNKDEFALLVDDINENL